MKLSLIKADRGYELTVSVGDDHVYYWSNTLWGVLCKVRLEADDDTIAALDRELERCLMGL